MICFYTGCVRKNEWISQGNKIGKASSNPNFIVAIRFANTCSLFVEYNIIHMMSLASDTGVEEFSEVIHHSRGHIWWNRRDFFSNRCLQLVQCMWSMFINFRLQMAPKEEIAARNECGRLVEWRSQTLHFSKTSLRRIHAVHPRRNGRLKSTHSFWRTLY
jgi:hypothetical protein